MDRLVAFISGVQIGASAAARFGVTDASAAAYKRLSDQEEAVRAAANKMDIPVAVDPKAKVWAANVAAQEPPDNKSVPPPVSMPLPPVCSASNICPSYHCLVLNYGPCSTCMRSTPPGCPIKCCDQDFMNTHCLCAHDRNDRELWNSCMAEKPSCQKLLDSITNINIAYIASIEAVVSNLHLTGSSPVFRKALSRLCSSIEHRLKNHYPTTLRDYNNELATKERYLEAAQNWVIQAQEQVVLLTSKLDAALHELIPQMDTMHPAISTHLVSSYCSQYTAPGCITAQLNYYAGALNFMTTGRGKYAMPSDLAERVLLAPHPCMPPHLPTNIPQLLSEVRALNASIAGITGWMTQVEPLLAQLKA